MKKTNWKLWVGIVLGLLLVIGGLVGVKAAQINAMIEAGKKMVPPPEAVTTTKVEATQWLSSRPAVATLVAVRSVTVSSEVPGLVKQLSFDSGQSVRAGDVLVRLDTSIEQAQLQAAEADAKLAEQNLSRARRLREGQSNTVADLEAAEGREASTKAQVATLRATIAKKTIHAPFAGKLGIRMVELGQVLSPGTALASLTALNPIHAEFSLPQQTLSELQPGMRARLHTDTFGEQSWEGRITTINTEVDVATRNVKVRATFPNEDGKLRPGMFANVEVLSNEEHKVLVIPATSVLYAPYGDSVFSVEEKKQPDGKSSLIAHQKFVRLGERRGDLVQITSGVEAGETIVSSGVFKLRNGSAVMVRNDLAPKTEIAPRPTDR